jgi:hypothetical protein
MNLPPNVVEALQKGNKIEAIKLLRQMTKMGLAEAKSMIEMQAQAASRPAAAKPASSPAVTHSTPHVPPHATVPPVTLNGSAGLSPGEVPRTPGGGISFLVLAVIAVIAAWYFLKG